MSLPQKGAGTSLRRRDREKQRETGILGERATDRRPMTFQLLDSAKDRVIQ
jgi:hypothetical protein